jgi:hypothetical protein
MAAAMARTRASASAVLEANATPQMPHTLLLHLRSEKECGARPYNVLEEMKARDSQLVIRVPVSKNPQQEKKDRPCCGSHHNEKRFMLQQQAAPVRAGALRKI